ncbi:MULTISPECIES: FkbM family methyltransferase [unclassified Microcoleus]|uniref:FkbM family methyltransferase n=1 Tax=unclassified Microcoleus TaxID=2642155 RepID=UPI002FD4C995
MEAKKTAVDYLDEGALLLGEGNLEGAIAAYHRAIEQNPDHSWSHHNLGEALAKLGQFEKAIAAYRRAIELNPDFSWSYHHLGDALDRQQQWEEAVVAFRRAIELNAEHFGTYCGLGHSLAKLGQLDEAIAAYRRASELEPDADWIQYRLGEVLQQRTQLDLEGAIASYRRAIELNPDDLQAYRKLLQIQPDNLEVCLQLGKALVKQEQWEEAIAPYRCLTELNPDDVQAYYRLGELLIKQGDLEGAIDTLRHALELSPNSDESYYNLGEALAPQGNTTEASLCYYKAFKLNPNNMQANQKRPRIYDCFAFFNELDVLRIRIEELKDVVDKFILVEATTTFSGNPKPLYYQEFSHEFAQYQDKIIHYVVDDMPEIDYSQPVHLQAWPLDVHQKNCISRVLDSLDCKDEDIILVNDCDEIPRKEALSEAIELLKNNEFVIFVQDLYHGHLNNIASEWWCGTVACKYKDFKVRTYTQVRYSDKINTGLDMSDPGYKRSGYINSSQCFEHPYIVKGGWSFSWFGSELSRRYKLQSFAHKEGDDSQARGIQKIKYDVCRPSLEMESSGEFYFDVRDIEGKDVPEFLIKNILKYRHFLQPRQTGLMAKIGGDFKQVETQLNLLKNEAIKVKVQLEKSLQNLLKVCESLAERGNLLEAIAQWRQLVEIYPEFTSKKCFLSNLDGIKTFRINPEDYTLISGQLLQAQAGQQLVSQTGNNGQICYGPYISLPAGLYRVKLYLENSDYSGNPEGSNSGKIWFKFDVAVSKGLVIYQENVYNNHQAEHEFFIDVNVQDLEIRFWATGLFFAVNFIELNLIYQTDLQKDVEAYQQKPSIRKIEKIEVKDTHTNYGQFIYAEWNHPNEISRDWAASALYCLKTVRWGQYILPGTIAIDIGAHSGDTALPMALLTGSTGRVLAFEPNPYVYEILKFNQYLNRNSLNIEIFDLAIMEKEGTYEFTYGDSECCNGGYDDLFGWNTTNPNVRVIPVKGVNLATFLQAQFGQEYDNILKRLSFIKIDCEGYDKEVIKTLKPIIDVAKPALFVEWFVNFNQEQTDDLFQSIHSLGYSCYNPITLELQEADVNKKIPDILCLPNDYFEKVDQPYLVDTKTYLEKDTAVEQEVNVTIFNETGEFNVIKRFINSGETVFDIGANVGGWTEEVLNVVPDVEVHIFEAVPKIYQELIKNITSKNLFRKLIPNNCAVSKTDGVTKICYYPDSPQWSTMYRRGFHVESTCGLQPPQSVDVLATSIDGYCNRLGIKRVNFLKIDVEGAELDVLSGAKELLKSGRIDYIQFEYGGTYLDAGTTLKQIFDLLSQYRYSIFKILPEQLEYLPSFSPNYEDFQFSNFLAVNERFRSAVLGEPPEQMIDVPQLCRDHSIVPGGVIHVGAHEGGELKTYQEMGIKRVLFIEANPDVAERLKKRMAGMLEVQVVNCAISNQNGTVELIVTNNEMSSSILPLKVHGDIYPTIQVTHKLTVEAKTLDTLLEEMQLQASDFNILNIDIQGAELLAFQGATNLLKYIEVINTEVNYEELYEGCALIDQIDDFLEAYGFERRATTTPYNPTWGDACYVKKPLITMSTLGINGQFGNQIFQYAFLKIYAKQHNLRVETPEWIGQYLFGHNDPIISRQLPIVEERHPIVPAQIPYQKDPCKNVDFWGFFQYRTTFYAPHKEYFRSLFKPIQEVEATMKVALENLNSRGKTLIGIHLRRGDIKDFSLDENLYYYPAPTEWYKDWLRDIWENIEQPVLFVASDSLEEVIDDFAEFQPVTVKELGIDLPPASFYPDFYLLSQCEMVAISNSSFSFVTCLLNKEGKLFYRPCRKREKLIPFLPWDSYPLAEAVRMQ